MKRLSLTSIVSIQPRIWEYNLCTRSSCRVLHSDYPPLISIVPVLFVLIIQQVNFSVLFKQQLIDTIDIKFTLFPPIQMFNLFHFIYLFVLLWLKLYSKEQSDIEKFILNDWNMNMYTHTHTHTHIYIYIYICIFTGPLF